jgi:DNA-binding transcriptional ArsR family regulator
LLDVFFGALADSTRRQLIQRLVVDGPASASALHDHFAVTRQAIVKHLTVLEDAGLVRRQRRGREVLFVATPEKLATGVAWLLDASGQWDRRIERLLTALVHPSESVPSA